MTLDELYTIILNRMKTKPEGSYVANLFIQGKDRIIQKVGEEAVETVIAAKNGGKEQLINETADLLFHLLILLASNNITPQEVLDELNCRHKK